MTLLYISDSSIPSRSANSIHVMKMCSAWAHQGHQVTLLAKNTTACIAGIENIYDFYGVDNNFKLRLFPFRSFPGSGRLYNLLLPFFALGLYEIVYTRAIYPAMWYSLIGRRFAFEIHEPFDTKSRWLRKLFLFIINRNKVCKWVAISEALKKYLHEVFMIQNDRIVVAHDGANEIPESVKTLSLDGEFRVGYVGSLLRGKGLELLIPLASRLPEVTFHIVGGASGEVEHIRNGAAKGVNNLVFHGFVTPLETVRYMKSVDVLIAPYQSHVYVKEEAKSNNIANWMSPLKIFEYMAAGKPIITSDLPVLREILFHGKNALLCNPDRPDEWVNAIKELKDDTALAERLANTAKSDLESKHTWAIRAQFIFNNLTSIQS